MINIIRQKASEVVQSRPEEMGGRGGSDLSVAASDDVQCRRQLRFSMKELVDTEVTYVKVGEVYVFKSGIVCSLSVSPELGCLDVRLPPPSSCCKTAVFQ